MSRALWVHFQQLEDCWNYRVPITKEDIQNGKRHSTQLCPIAIAVKRALVEHFKFPPKLYVSICKKRMFIGIPRGSQFYESEWNLLPKWRDWISRFDHGKPVKPIIFRFSMKKI